MKLTHRDWEGYGVYEFMAPVPAPTVYSGFGFIPGGLPDPATLMVTDGGIQVLKSEYRAMALTWLDQTTFDADGDVNAPVVTGQANAILGTFGDGWASDFAERGYCIMAKLSSLKGVGTMFAPEMMMASAPGYIADNASVGGEYVVVKCPPALLDQAKALKAGQPSIPGVVNGKGNGKNGGVTDLDCPQGQVVGPAGTQWAGKCLAACPSGHQPDPQGHCLKANGAPVKAETKTPSWVWPAAIGVGAIALVALMTTGTTQRNR